MRKVCLALTGALVSSFYAGSAQAAILGVGSLAGFEKGGQLIDAPAAVHNESGKGGYAASPSDTNPMKGFNEKQNFTLEKALMLDGKKTIAAGTRISSHMIFLNQPDQFKSKLVAGATWLFSGNILGVISSANGSLQTASDYLGAPGTIYPGSFKARGLESNNPGGSNLLKGDGYRINGNELSLAMHVTQPGDWIRVITAADDTSSAAAVPEPATITGVLVAGAIGARLRKRSNKSSNA